MDVKSVYTSILILFFIYQINNVGCANILGLFPSTGRSHFIIDEALMKALAAKGHNVTIISAFPPTTNGNVPNYHEIYLDLNDLSVQNERMADILQNPGQSSTATSGPGVLNWLIPITLNRSVSVLEHKKMQQIMNSGQQFDLLVFGWFLNDFLLGIGGHFRCPIVVITTFLPPKPVRDLVGNPIAVSSAPMINRENDKIPMTFIQRVVHFIISALEFIAFSALDHFVYRSYYNQYFPAAKNYPTYDEVKENVSLVLVNHHFTQGKPRPYVPNMIEISGIQIKEKPDLLPENINEFINSAEYGVILFALGTNAKFSDMNIDKLRIIFNAISKLKQKFLMKWELDTLPKGIPSNALLLKWLPQADILAHPKTRLFISHCGLSSTNEAKFYGVPILAIPLFGDQPINAQNIVEQGWGIQVSYDALNEENFSKALNEILSNSSYTDIVKRLSQLYRDRPQSPLETAVFWVDYIIRHNGARHMKSDAAYQNFFQKNSLDVLAFLFIVSLILWKTLKFVLRQLFRRFYKLVATIKQKIE